MKLPLIADQLRKMLVQKQNDELESQQKRISSLKNSSEKQSYMSVSERMAKSNVEPTPKPSEDTTANIIAQKLLQSRAALKPIAQQTAPPVSSGPSFNPFLKKEPSNNENLKKKNLFDDLKMKVSYIKSIFILHTLCI